MKQNIGIIVIGGSWGGIQASLDILKDLPPTYPIPILLVLHRLKNFESDLPTIFSKRLQLQVAEVDEKEEIKPGNLYIAPANYHVLIESDHTFALDDSEFENYSRPSIDVTFTAASDIFGNRVAGILLSGANRDGSLGLMDIKKRGGIAIAQDPMEAEVDTMPKSAIMNKSTTHIYKAKEIRNFLVSLSD